MATYTITIPAEHVTDTVNAFCNLGNFVETPETTQADKVAFAKGELLRQIKFIVKRYKEQQAAETAKAAVPEPNFTIQ